MAQGGEIMECESEQGQGNPPPQDNEEVEMVDESELLIDNLKEKNKSLIVMENGVNNEEDDKEKEEEEDSSSSNPLVTSVGDDVVENGVDNNNHEKEDDGGSKEKEPSSCTSEKKQQDRDNEGDDLVINEDKDKDGEKEDEKNPEALIIGDLDEPEGGDTDKENKEKGGGGDEEIDLRCEEKVVEGGEIADNVAMEEDNEPDKKKPNGGGGEGEEDEEGEGSLFGLIKLRDIASLREEDESDDDDVVLLTPDEPPKVNHTPYAMECDLGKGAEVPWDWSCEEGTKITRNKKVSSHEAVVLRQKLGALQDTVMELVRTGKVGLSVKEGSAGISFITPNLGQNNPASTALTASALLRSQMMQGHGQGNVIRSYSTTTPTPVPGGPTRVAPNTPTSVSYTLRTVSTSNNLGTRTQMITTRPHILSGGVTQTLQQPLRFTTATPTPGITQLVYDPSTGVLMYPAPAGTTPVSGPQTHPNGTMGYRTVFRAPPPILNAIRQTTTTVPNSYYVNQGTTVRIPSSQLNLNTQRTYALNRLPRSTTPQQMAPVNTNIRPIAPRTQPLAAARTPQPQRVIRPPVPAPLRNQSQNLQRQQQSAEKEIYIPPSNAAPVSSSFKQVSNGDGTVKATMNVGNKVTVTPSKDEKETDKTFPSLVVVVKPYLQDKLSKTQATGFRTELDSKVKTILMQPSQKLIEWLIQKGLIKLDQKCFTHGNSYKLAMYSDGEKFSSSGGYVFTTECCQDKQLSVFQGSIFEASMFPPQTTVKLIYHWACQTAAPNVLQWVKVNSYYLKNFFTLLRSVCVAALHENGSTIGGKGKYIEIGVVTLGTTAAGPSKQTRIEILGVLDPGSKFIRMRLINVKPGLTGEAAKRDRLEQILTPIGSWVRRESVLLIDSSLDKSLLENMGFRNISQTTATPGAPVKTTIPTNVNVMNYLRNIVPKMFQNTLSVLSKSLIQQFLDELSWRELWGPHPLRAFDTVMSHIVAMTKADTGENLIPRLNKISLNPFAEWSYSPKPLPPATGIECLPDSITAQPLSELVASAVGMDSSITSLVTSYMSKTTQAGSQASVKTTSATVYPKPSTGAGNKRKSPFPPLERNIEDDISDILSKTLREAAKTQTLQTYYYGFCPSAPESYKVEFPSNLKCPLCSKVLQNGSSCMTHIVGHANGNVRTLVAHSCKYCIKEFGSQSTVDVHIQSTHKKQHETNVCRICVERFTSEPQLILHMWKRHVACEAPYRCEVCDYRSSFHYDVVDHFQKDHAGTDMVQCPVCLKTFPVRSQTCLRNVITHLQSHINKKGKKCQDCCLVFSSDVEYRSHVLMDGAHDTRRNGNFIAHEVEGDPIRMPRPPQVQRDYNVPPPSSSKKSKTRKSSGSNLQTLNSTFAVPLNPGDKFMFKPAKLKISDIDMFVGMNCWECSRPINLAGHYRGTLKCSRCRFETCCTFAIESHVKMHDDANVNRKLAKAKAEFSRNTDLPAEALECSGCHFATSSTRRISTHLLRTGHKTCYPIKKSPSVPTPTPSSSTSTSV